MLFHRSNAASPKASAASFARLIVCVLAGGECRRFGQSKLNVAIDCMPLLAWQALRLGATSPSPELWLSVSPAHHPLPPGARSYRRIIVDQDRFAGPLLGMMNVLAVTRPCDVVAFVPADMPLLTADHLQPLRRALSHDASCVGVMAATIEGADHRLQPLPSVWRAGTGRQLIRRAIAAGVRGPSRLATWPGVQVVPVTNRLHASAWRSINRPDDMVQIAEDLGRAVAAP